MKTLQKKGFKLPFIGRARFTELKKWGLKYTRGFFVISNLNHVERIMNLLSEVLKEEVRFIQTCYLCDTEFLCVDCNHYDSCPSRDLPLQCICLLCAQQRNRIWVNISKKIWFFTHVTSNFFVFPQRFPV